MATELATAYLSLIPTLKGAGKSIQSELDGVNLDPSGRKMGEQLGDGLTDGAKTGGKGIMSALGGISKVAAPILAAVGFGQLAGEAAKATDATQKFKSTLDFAGLGSSQIDALTASTRKYADETVYELSDIQNITAQLAANGVKDYDRLAEAAGNLNAVAGGNAETYSRVGLVLTQTAGAGKLTTENWNQLADAIPGASGKLQEAMRQNGAYTGNFRDAMEKGEITAEEFNQALLQLGFEDAAVNAAKSTSTFEGAFGNLKAAAVGGLSDALAKVQPLVTGVINGIEPVVRGAFDFIVKGIDLFVKGVEEAGEYFGPFIQEIVGMVQANLPAIQAAWDGAMSAIKTVTETVWPIIDSVIQTVMGVIKGIISTVLAVIRGDWSGVWEGIKSIASSVWNGIKGVISNGIEVAKNVISNVLNVIKGIWDGAWNGLKSFVGSIWEGIKTGVSNGIDSVMTFIGELPGKITGFFSDAGSWLLDAGANILQGLWDGISNGLGWFGDKLKGIGDFIVEHKGPPAYDAVMLVKNGELIMNGLLRGMSQGWGDVEDFVKSRNVALSASYAVSPMASASAPAVSTAAVQRPSQTFVFNQPVKSPDEVARSVRMAERYGFAADY